MRTIEIPAALEVEGVEHLSFPLDGYDVHVAAAGDPDGSPVVLVHGWPQHWWAWRELIPALVSAGRRVYAPDLRGFGWSGTPGWGYSTTQYTQDLFDLMDAAGLARTDLVAHDWGCVVGYRAALEAPERFGRYVAMSAPGPHTSYTARSLATLWRYWYQQPLSMPLIGPRTVRRLGSTRSLVGRWIGVRALGPGAAAYMQQFEDPRRIDASVALYRDAVLHAFGLPLQPAYRGARLRVPTLHLHGAHDGPTGLAFVRPMGDRSDEWRLEVLEDRGHFLLDEAPAEVIDSVMRFLEPR